MPEYADRQMHLAYVLINPRLQARAAVFFYLDFDEQGGADTGWNPPLRNLAERRRTRPRHGRRADPPGLSQPVPGVLAPDAPLGPGEQRRTQPFRAHPRRAQAQPAGPAGGRRACRGGAAAAADGRRRTMVRRRSRRPEGTARGASAQAGGRADGAPGATGQAAATTARRPGPAAGAAPGRARPAARRGTGQARTGTPAGNWTSCAAKCSACNRPWNGRRGRTPNCSSVCWSRASSSSATARN